MSPSQDLLKNREFNREIACNSQLYFVKGRPRRPYMRLIECRDCLTLFPLLLNPFPGRSPNTAGPFKGRRKLMGYRVFPKFFLCKTGALMLSLQSQGGKL